MTSVFEFEKKFRKGKKFEEKETKGDVFRKKIKEAIKNSESKSDGRKPKNIMKMEKSLENLMKDERFPKKEKPPIEFKRRKTPNLPRRVPGEQKEMIPLKSKGRGRIIDGEFYPAMAKGGRAGFKMGSKCKLAIKGKGRAYGKNS